jgi:hypothetical protein
MFRARIGRPQDALRIPMTALALSPPFGANPSHSVTLTSPSGVPNVGGDAGGRRRRPFSTALVLTLEDTLALVVKSSNLRRCVSKVSSRHKRHILCIAPSDSPSVSEL